MRIMKVHSRHRRDFTYDAECEHCGHVERRLSGYDDRNFHDNVVPALVCTACNKAAPDEPREVTQTRYPEGLSI